MTAEQQAGAPVEAGTLRGAAEGGDGLVRSSAVMASGTLLSRLTGLLRAQVLAWVLGQATLASVYAYANTTPNVFYELAVGGVLTSLFVPVVVMQFHDREPKDAWAEVANMAWVGLAAATAMTVVLALVSPWLVSLTAPGLSGHARTVAIVLVVLLAAEIIFYAATTITAGILNAKRRFAAAAYAPVANNVLVIVMLGAFAVMNPDADLADVSTAQLLLLGLGTTAGIAAMALAQLPALRRLLREESARLRFRFDLRAPAIRRVVQLAGWMVLYVATNQVLFMVVQRLALGNDAAAGDFAAWTQAFLFFQLPNGIVAVSVFTVLLPRLSQYWQEGDRPRFANDFGRGVRLILFLVVPATVAYFVLAGQILEVLLQYGNFGGADTARAASLLELFALALVPYTVFLLVLRSFYAMQDTRTPALVNLGVTAVVIAVDVAIFPIYGIEGLVVGFGLNYLLSVIVCWALLRRRVGTLHTGALGGVVGRQVLAALLMGAALVGVLALVGAVGPDDDTRLSAALELLVGVPVAAVVYLAATRLLGVSEIAGLVRRFRRRTPAAAANND